MNVRLSALRHPSSGRQIEKASTEREAKIEKEKKAERFLSRVGKGA
jgi:hypothetical protein